MSFINRLLKQTITVFSVGSKDLYGKPTWVKSTIKGRWEDKQQEFVDSLGKESISSAVVFVSQDVATGSYLYLGSSTASTPPAGAREVKAFSNIPDISATRYLKTAILK